MQSLFVVYKFIASKITNNLIWRCWKWWYQAKWRWEVNQKSDLKEIDDYDGDDVNDDGDDDDDDLQQKKILSNVFVIYFIFYKSEETSRWDLI